MRMRENQSCNIVQHMVFLPFVQTIDKIKKNNNVKTKKVCRSDTILVEHLTDWLASEIIYTIDRIVRFINNDPLPYSRNCLQLIMQ